MRYILAVSVLVCAVGAARAGAGPVTGADGVLRFAFGERNVPTLRCAPLFVCDLVLEPGETIVNVAVGDSVRWLIAPAMSGPSSTATPHVLVKPTDVSLRTNLIITTNRRTYYVTLVSRKDNPMMRIGFTYPENLQEAFGSAVSRTSRAPASRAPATIPQVSADKLDFAYRMTGDRNLQPVRVFNDGTHTFLQMPTSMTEIPVVFVVRDEGDELVNYRMMGHYYMIDGVPDRLALVDSSGRHQRRAIVARGN